MELTDRIRHFILENYLFSEDQSLLRNEDSFLERGILDSTGVLEVIYFLEEEFGISVEDEEMIPENLDSVDRLVAYIGSKATSLN